MRTVEADLPLPEGALEKYAGKWIAVRDGEVVGAASSHESLRAEENVNEDDVLYHVPPLAAVD